MSHDWQTMLVKDPQYPWWTGWLHVPALAELTRRSDEAIEAQCASMTEDDEGQAEDPELEELAAESESLFNNILESLGDPDQLVEMMKKLNPQLDPDAPIEAGGGRTLRDVYADTAEQARRFAAGEDKEDDGDESDDALLQRLKSEEAVQNEHLAAGELELTVEMVEAGGISGGEDVAQEPSPAQIAAVEDFRRNHSARLPTILAAVADYANDVRDIYSQGWMMFGDSDGFDQIMPVHMTPDQAAERIGFRGIIVEHREKDGLAYIRLDGGCSWDEEHGLGVTLHGDRIVGVGPSSEPAEDEQEEG